MLHQIEHIALGGAQRIPPAVSVVVDDQDLALAAAVFQGATGAFPAIEPPAGGPALQQRGAADLTAKQVELGVTDSHGLFLLWGLVAPALCHRSPLAFGVRRPRSGCGARAEPAWPGARHTARPLRRGRRKRYRPLLLRLLHPASVTALRANGARHLRLCRSRPCIVFAF